MGDCRQIEDGPRAEATRRASAKRVAKPPVPPPDSVFGYFFGSQQQQQSNPMRETMGVELATNPMRKFLDLTTDSIPYSEPPLCVDGELIADRHCSRYPDHE